MLIVRLIPVLFELVRWSARHDSRSEARRIPGLLELIEKDNRATSDRAADQVRRGEGVVRSYLK